MRVEVRDGAFGYPGPRGSVVPVLRDVNFSFSGKGVFAVLGPNGAGKTTLLKCLLGLLPWTRGESRFDNRPLTAWPRREFWSRTAYVPQAKTSSLAALTISEYVVLGRSARLGAFARPGAADWEAADRAMETVGITSLAARRTNEVSGGQLQLAAIARALAGAPELLILDEPESNLDFRNQALVLDVIDRLAADGLGVILNTHFPAHALLRASECLLVPRGEAPVFGPARELLTEERLSALFSIPVTIRTLEVDGRPLPVVAAHRREPSGTL
ncbi:ABC transporter ATP-binding protein [Sutterella sp.]|uniref:ABC transporter ATP-binding protein n=1 Tax=Sutterella sp. TaxID=1981025 RepID=UPI0026E00947|nr:ABC transporter ATP-binding protein [Sutterella sp.]MDO5532223.1 ABC transporter ATP-binding protein [Sutterella sp.]